MVIKYIIFISLIISNVAFAHSGNTNKDGCHNDRINGGYHCHNKKSPTSNQNSTQNNCNFIEKRIMQCDKSKENEQINYLKERVSQLENEILSQKDSLKKTLNFRDQYLINDALWLQYSCQKYGVKYVIDAKNRIYDSMQSLNLEDTTAIRDLFKNEIKKSQK